MAVGVQDFGVGSSMAVLLEHRGDAADAVAAVRGDDDEEGEGGIVVHGISPWWALRRDASCALRGRLLERRNRLATPRNH
jgi:hypothetical protein